MFADRLNEELEDYTYKFQQETVEMTDFSIRVKNLPHHAYYGDNDNVMRAILTAHFEEIIKDELKRVQEKADDNGNDFDFTSLAQIDYKKSDYEVNPLDYEIADINFGKSDLKQMSMIMKLGNLQN